ncbi:hypothetical protein QBC40DRAFT_298902 [Triangularia verruculosa]|uniref:BZIP domain-containing protein n=1 Tax=Triangularia verruculosa TaxID=2587418 RepID=A0AAN6XCC8_9PEZI|nr:hypothetical protein QBC40DRAFT_298902 [Triangularia verruculosa]
MSVHPPTERRYYPYTRVVKASTFGPFAHRQQAVLLPKGAVGFVTLRPQPQGRRREGIWPRYFGWAAVVGVVRGTSCTRRLKIPPTPAPAPLHSNLLRLPFYNYNKPPACSILLLIHATLDDIAADHSTASTSSPSNRLHRSVAPDLIALISPGGQEMSGSMSTSPAATQPGLLDPLDSFVDLSDFDNNFFQSPSLSPAGSNKGVFARPIKAETTTANTLLPTNQTLSGPSHQYDLYKQQTGIVPGAIATTFSLNQPNAHLHGFNNGFGSFDYLTMGNTDELFDFNAAPSQGSMTSPELETMDFDSPPSDPSNFFFDSTINPSNIGGQEPAGLSSPPPQVFQPGRVWPGMHQQAALAKQQQQQQQRQRAQAQQRQSKPAQKAKSPQASDPIVEQKITQLLNSMRAKTSEEPSQNNTVLNIPRPKKDEDEMDEDERLLASEEGKKLSSKERRQLRNKVSARAFRSRRKEYITQLEAEIANKVTENGDLRAQNRALVDENKRLTDLTRMLLGSPSFSDFLNQLSTNPQTLPQSQPQQTPQPEQQRQLPKDINPYTAQQQLHNQQINLAMVPEQVDFSLVNMEPSDGFSYQPQVFAVLETPEPIFDANLLSGKSSNFVGHQFDSDDDEKDLPVIEQAPVLPEMKKQEPAPIDEDFESNPDFVLYHDSPAPTEPIKGPVELDVEAPSQSVSQLDIFGGIEPEKALARYELVNSTEEEAAANRAVARIQRLSMKLDSITSRLEMLGVGL